MNDLSVQQNIGTRVHYLLPGLRCAGCALKVERALNELPGVTGVNVNYAEKRLSLHSASGEVTQKFLETLEHLGYPAAPDRGRAGLDLLADERRSMLARLGVAGIGMMQVMMFALADYVAGPQGIEADYESLMRWASLVIATPVVFFSALPFHRGALRDLRNLSPGMDVPVSLAILSAWTLSVVNTLGQSGEVFFDSACMFTFFLLTGRYLELGARRSFQVEETLGEHLLPESARQLDGKLVSIDELIVGSDYVAKADETIAGDGIVISGSATVDESAFTGEPDPVSKVSGSRLLAGTRIVDGEVTFHLDTPREAWVITHLSELYRSSAAYKPAFALLADSIARYFVVGVLCLSAASGLFWFFAGSEDYFAIALAVLVVSCPCALSLATPVAYTMASAAVRKAGLLVGNGAFLDRLADIDQVVFDKTGTLTTGTLQLDEVRLLDNSYGRAEVLRIAASLEAGSRHPVATSLVAASAGTVRVEEHAFVPGFGAEGLVDGKFCRIGKPDFAGHISVPDGNRNWVLLSIQDSPAAWFGFSDRLREGAVRVAEEIKATLPAADAGVMVYSGDSSSRGMAMMNDIGLDARMSMTPDMKIQGIRNLQAQGHRVLMIGDGINDAGALGVADLSLAINPVDSIVQSAADATMVNPDISFLPRVFRYARKVNRVIRQNLGWALAYNLSVIPLAMFGFVPPWVAALGMSMSSLLVTLNACRLSRIA